MALLSEIRKCQICLADLPLEPKPILNFSKKSRIVLIGQAPGLKTHNIGIPWSDKSGDRLRDWLGLSSLQFYDEKLLAFVPMSFCYPGTGKSGDLPPLPKCAPTWHNVIFNYLTTLKLKIYIGDYSYRYYFPDDDKTLTEKVKEKKLKDCIILPHPSPRNNIWLKKNSWFEEDYLPLVKKKIKSTLK